VLKHISFDARANETVLVLTAQDLSDDASVRIGSERMDVVIQKFRLSLGNAVVFDGRNRRIRLAKKKLLPEDDIAFRFARVLDEVGVRYVAVAQYVAILLGRPGRTDDIDIIVERIDEERFIKLCRRAFEHGFTLMQGDISSEESMRRVYRDYLAEGLGVRFMYRDIVVPNIELRAVRSTIDRYALEHSIAVELNGKFVIRISPLELQIAYKLYLGSERDVGDAVFLYTLFRDALDSAELERWCRELNVNCDILRSFNSTLRVR